MYTKSQLTLPSVQLYEVKSKTNRTGLFSPLKIDFLNSSIKYDL
jgi:hypothetical protein